LNYYIQSYKLRTGQDISQEEIDQQVQFLNRVDPGGLLNMEDSERRKLEDLKIEKGLESKEDPQAENAEALRVALQEKEEAERIQRASEQLLVEGASNEELEAERQAALEAQLALQQQQDRERIDKEYAELSKKVRDFLSPVPVVKYMKNLLIKQKGRGNSLSQEAVSYILRSIKQVNSFAIAYLSQYPKYSFKEEQLESNPKVKKLYILSFLLKRVAKVKQLSEETKGEIETATSTFDKIFSSGMGSFLNEVDKTVKTTYPKYAGFIQRIKDLNKIG
jgi:hypothetical protein